MENEVKETKTMKVARAADGLSLGISMVVAVVIGVLIGLWLKGFWGLWGLGAGVALGVFAAMNNVYKAYRAQQASYDELGSTHFPVKPDTKKNPTNADIEH